MNLQLKKKKIPIVVERDFEVDRAAAVRAEHSWQQRQSSFALKSIDYYIYYYFINKKTVFSKIYHLALEFSLRKTHFY